VRALARVFAATEARVAATAFAAVQDAQELPVGPLARGDGACGVQGGGGLAVDKPLTWM
jgi:hypothetical protein